MIADMLKKRDCFYNDDLINSIAQYIEDVNNSAGPDDKTYTPDDWFKDTITQDNEMIKRGDNPSNITLVNREHVMLKALNYLYQQRQLCIEQTGHEPTMEDYINHCESEEFKNITFGYVTIDTLINYIISQKNYCLMGDDFRW